MSASKIEQQILELQKHRFGLLKQLCAISCLPCDGFQSPISKVEVSLPFCDRELKWDFMFDRDETIPPDIILDSEFMYYLNHETLKSSVPSLLTWDLSRKDSLLKVILELQAAWQKYSIMKLNKSSRVEFEYSSLVEQLNLSSSDIQVYYGNDEDISFMIKLYVDFSETSSFIQRNCEDIIAVLKVSFHSVDASSSDSVLLLSSQAIGLLHGEKTFTIPPLTQDICLMDYVPTVKKLLEKKIKNLQEDFVLRKSLVAELIAKFSSNIIELDVECYTKVVVLFDWQDFHFLLIIEIPYEYPGIKPSLLFKSVYHFLNQESYSLQLSDYPYSSQWSVKDIVEKMHTSVLNKVTEFHELSLKCDP